MTSLKSCPRCGGAIMTAGAHGYAGPICFCPPAYPTQEVYTPLVHEQTIATLREDLRLANAAREDAERERDEARDLYTETEKLRCEETTTMLNLRADLEECQSALNRANDATTREEQRAIAAEARLAACSTEIERRLNCVARDDEYSGGILDGLDSALSVIEDAVANTRPQLAVVEGRIEERMIGSRKVYIVAQLPDDFPAKEGDSFPIVVLPKPKEAR